MCIRDSSNIEVKKIKDKNIEVIKFQAPDQKFPGKDDWILEIYENLEFCDINLNEEEIRKMSKYTFKKLVNKQIKLKAEEYLASIQDGHSKTKDLGTYQFQPYLTSKNMSTKEKQLLFQLRTRTTPTRANYKNKYKFDLSCPLCKDKTTEQTDAHLLNCSAITKLIPITTNLDKMNYEMIFNDSEDQTKVIKVYQELFKYL